MVTQEEKKQVFPAARNSKLDTTSCLKTSPAGQQSIEANLIIRFNALHN
jgi:hypothetical protein